MNSGKQSRGYTIIEVMIVLAVSGLMFLIAANFISGKQARTAFTSGTNEMTSRVQDIIEQVTDGKFSDVPLKCSADTTSTSPNGVVAGTEKQGTNAKCVFLGKIMHFSVSGVPESYEIFSLAGGLNNTGGTLSNANPAVITRLTTGQTVSQNLQVKEIRSGPGGTGTDLGYAIGFTQGVGAVNGLGELSNGSQSVSIYYVSGVTSNDSSTAASAKVNGASMTPIQTAYICLTDGERYAEIIIGDNSSQLNATLKVDGSTAC